MRNAAGVLALRPERHLDRRRSNPPVAAGFQGARGGCGSRTGRIARPVLRPWPATARRPAALRTRPVTLSRPACLSLRSRSAAAGRPSREQRRPSRLSAGFSVTPPVTDPINRSSHRADGLLSEVPRCEAVMDLWAQAFAPSARARFVGRAAAPAAFRSRTRRRKRRTGRRKPRPYGAVPRHPKPCLRSRRPPGCWPRAARTRRLRPVPAAPP